MLSRFNSSCGVTKKTPFYDLHVKFGGELTDFCGYYLPIKYANSEIGIEHANTRKKCTFFDVSHMGQFKLTGASRMDFMERLIVADVHHLPMWSTKLSVFTNYRGGINDDMMCTKCPNHLYLVVNAACKEKDWNHLSHHIDLWRREFGDDLKLEDMSNARGLLALQGPNAMKILQKYTNVNLAAQPFMSQRHGKIAGVDCFITRCGYTGEDGFEISIPREQCMRIGTLLSNDPGVSPAGLGSRDSLRLEAGLCLYGHEINDESTPIEGGLKWLIPKKRQEKGGFLGADVILPQIHGERPLRFMRCGLVVKGAPAREQTAVYDNQGLKQVGEVRSGLFAPTLGYPIAQAWMLPSHMEPGTELKVRVRGRMQPAKVVPMPFVNKPFYRVPKTLKAEKVVCMCGCKD